MVITDRWDNLLVRIKPFGASSLLDGSPRFGLLLSRAFLVLARKPAVLYPAWRIFVFLFYIPCVARVQFGSMPHEFSPDLSHAEHMGALCDM
jgi:hypothetical protein